jgi:hypothetical protein
VLVLVVWLEIGGGENAHFYLIPYFPFPSFSNALNECTMYCVLEFVKQSLLLITFIDH